MDLLFEYQKKLLVYHSVDENLQPLEGEGHSYYNSLIDFERKNNFSVQSKGVVSAQEEKK